MSTLYYETNDTIVGRLTRLSVPFKRSDKQSRRDAIAKAEKQETAKLAELERRLGRKLTDAEIASGTIQHEETRSKRELMQRDMTVQEQPEAPENPHRAAANYLKSTLEEKNPKPRERAALEAERRANEFDAERAAEAKREAIANDPKVQEAAAVLRDFVVDIKFSPCDVATVERAESLLQRVTAGNLDDWEAERDAIGESVYEAVYAGELAETEAELLAKRERASYWKPKPSEPKPSESSETTFTLEDLRRNAESKRQPAEPQPVEQLPTSEADDDWGIDAAFDDLIAQVRALRVWDEPKGGDSDGE